MRGEPVTDRATNRVAEGAASVAAVAVTLGAGVVASRWLIARQARIARERIGKPLGEQAIDADRVWRPGLAGGPVDLAIVGDSIAAGLGAERPKQTFGARLAKGLAVRLDRPIRLRSVAVVGAESRDLAGQLDRLELDHRPPALAVIVVGGNDVIHRASFREAASLLEAAITRLVEAGTSVVVGTTPDLRALRPVPQPLRSLVGRQSWLLASAQAAAARRAGASVVSLRRVVGRLFIDEPDTMFSIDRFHPSALGYRRTADAILPVLEEAYRARGATP